jgi:hypothetical protein
VQCCRPHGVRDQSGKLFPGIEATNTSDKGGSPSQHRANQGPGHSKVIEGSWASIEWKNRMDLGRRTGKVCDKEEEAKDEQEFKQQQCRFGRRVFFPTCV